MIHDTGDSSVRLLLTEGSPFFNITNDVLARIKKWVNICVEQDGIIQASISRMDEDHTIHLMASWPPDAATSILPPQAVKNVIHGEKPFIFRDHEELISVGIFPLTRNGKIAGLLCLFSNQTDYFKPGTVTWINALAGTISESLFKHEQENEEQEAEHRIAMILQSSLDLHDHLPTVVESLAALLNADAVTALGLSPSSQRFELLATYGLNPSILAKLNLFLETGLARKNIDGYQPIWIEDLQSNESYFRPISCLNEDGFRSYLALPLMGHNELAGVVEFLWRKPHHIDPGSYEFLDRVAGQLALAIQRGCVIRNIQHRNDELLKRYDAMITGLSRALEFRDIETEGHTRRVSELTMRLVEHMHIPSEQWDAIRQGALLHDIGKLGIPDKILLKPGSLDPQERKVMQQHVRYGYKILADIFSARHTLDITLYHHEHWNGKGYPDGLKGEQIPLVARMFAVVDVFDALKSDRPYRAAWSHLKVLQYIQVEAGRQFDPHVVKLFLEIAGEIDQF